MRVPKRHSETLRESKLEPQDLYLTAEAVERLKRKIKDLEHERPEVIAELQRTAEMGDFSENFAYQQAKQKLRRINDQLLTLEERIKTAIPIEKGTDESGRVRIGSTVSIRAGEKPMTFQILGSQETNPSRGSISYLSPLGKALMGHVAGDVVAVQGPNGAVEYLITNVS